MWLAAGSRPRPGDGKESDDWILGKVSIDANELGPKRNSAAEEREYRALCIGEQMVMRFPEGGQMGLLDEVVSAGGAVVV